MSPQKVVVMPTGTEATYDRFHFAPAIRSSDHLYCSGVIGLGPDRKAPADPETQFALAFEALKNVLTAAGGSFDDIVDLTTYHVGLQAHLATFMKVKDQFIAEPYPAWTAIGITELAVPGALVEIKAVARRQAE